MTAQNFHLVDRAVGEIAARFVDIGTVGRRRDTWVPIALRSAKKAASRPRRCGPSGRTIAYIGDDSCAGDYFLRGIDRRGGAQLVDEAVDNVQVPGL
jgi:hypothetical protein